MENLGICQICKTREGVSFDADEKWVCEKCDYASSYLEFDYDDNYVDAVEDFNDSYRF